MDSQSPLEQEKPEGRPENARRLFIVISILACFGLLGGVWSIKTSIEQPLAFTNNPVIINQLHTQTNDTANDALQLIALKTQDTDQDGLTDYDELYQYGSSPYIQDSDSDGISDKDEIDNGTDPNCPEGTECTPIAVFTPTGTNTSTTTTNSSTSTNTNPNVANLDVIQLRTTLRNAGAPQAELDVLSDEELVALYAETLGSGIISTNTNSTNSTEDTTSVTYAQLRDLSADQIRQLLVLGGAGLAKINQLDDETLKAVFYESVQNLEFTDTNQ